MIENVIIHFINPADAAKKYKIEVATLFRLGDEKKIVMVFKDGKYIIDEYSLRSYLEAQKLNEYLEMMISERKKEIDDLLAKYDDSLFIKHILLKNNEMFQIIISELSKLVSDETKRGIFLRVSLGEDIYCVGQKYGYNFAQTCKIYKSTVGALRRKALDLKRYQEENIDLRAKIQKKDSCIKNLKEKISLLEKMNCIITDSGITPEKIKYLLELNLQENFTFSTSCNNILRGYELLTVRDLIHFLKKHNGNIDALFKLRGMGPFTLNILKKGLLEKGIIEPGGYSFLVEHINDDNIPSAK